MTDAERRRLAARGQSHIAEQPAGTYARQILNRLLIDLSWNSSRLEGNSYSLLDTAALIDGGQAAPGRSDKDTQMILNHKVAIEFIVDNAQEIAFDRLTIMNLHAALANNLLDDPLAPGRLRRKEVAITGSNFQPLAVPQLIEECFDQLLHLANQIEDPFEQAFFVMVHIPYLQPFDDVNKRVSRIAANIPMVKRNLCPLSFLDVPDGTYVQGTLAVYELNRVELLRDVFVWAYDRSASRYAAVIQSLGEPDPFKLRHTMNIRNAIGEIIRGEMDKRAASEHLASWTEANIEPDEHARFREYVETELIGLNEGNFARYLVRPSVFRVWKEKWDA